VQKKSLPAGKKGLAWIFTEQKKQEKFQESFLPEQGKN
jgi:hypothetical protein